MILSIGAAFAFVNDKGVKFEIPTIMNFFINKKEEKLASEITEDDIEES